MPKTRFTADLPPELFARLTDYCEATGQSRNQVIADAIRKELQAMTTNRLTSGLSRYQIWDGLVGSQTADEFWTISQEQGAVSYQDAAERYVAHLVEHVWTSEDLPSVEDRDTIAKMLVEIMEEQIG